MKKGVKETNLPFHNINEELSKAYLGEIKPTGKDILTRMSSKFNDLSYLKEAEEQIYGYLQRFVAKLSTRDAGVFMKFVSGHENIGDVNVYCNGEILEELFVPRSETCDNIIFLSRYFVNEARFVDILSKVLSKSFGSAWTHNKHLWPIA